MVEEQKNQEGEGKLEFLKREEIRTMERDLSELREAEAKKERERIAGLRTDKGVRIEKEKKEGRSQEKSEDTEKEKKLLEFVGKRTKEIWQKEAQEAKEKMASFKPEKKELLTQEQPPRTVIPEATKKSSPFRKILARGVVVLILILAAGFLYWFFAIREKGAEEPQPSEKETPITEEVPEEAPEIIIPPSLLATVDTRTLEISSEEELPPLITQLLAEKFETLGAYRILIENTKENKLLGLEEFFQAFEIESPEGLLAKLDNDFTLFLKADETYNSLGLITKVEETEGLLSLVQGWEKTMSQDTEKLFLALGKEGEAIASSFRTSTYKGAGFRYLTISRTDFGLCYGWFDDYFVITSSFSSMATAVEGSRAKIAEERIGQLLIIGFEGKTLTPQFQEMFREYRPGGVLLLGNNIEDEAQLKKLTSDLQKLSLRETGLPLLIAVDQEGGPVSRIAFAKEKTAQLEIKNIEQAYQIGLDRGQELKELGINLNLAPLLDIADEGDFLSGRTFQKNGEEIGFLAKSLITGQKAAGILTAIKHFPGYGGITLNPEDELAELEKVPEIEQFEIAMTATPELIMTANVIYGEINPTLPFTFSSRGIQFLKDTLGQNVLIVSDDLAQDSLLDNFSLEDIMARPVEAGVDILIFSGWDIEVEKGIEAYYQAFRKDQISKDKVEIAVAKIINLKSRLSR